MIRSRSRINIFSQILEAADGGNVTKSRIMYKVFLNYSQLKEYLTILTANDLLRYDLVRKTFKTTEKGIRFLGIYRQIYDIIKEGERGEERQQGELIAIDNICDV
jgi:predicted transcriptional regulator